MSNTLRTNNPKRDGGRIAAFVKMQIIALQFVSNNLIEHIKLHHVAKCSLQEKVLRLFFTEASRGRRFSSLYKEQQLVPFMSFFFLLLFNSYFTICLAGHSVNFPSSYEFL